MATTLTFDSLISDVQAYLERGGSSTTDSTFYAQLPRVINAAERRCARTMKVEALIDVVISDPALGGGFVAGTSVYEKPALWRNTTSFSYGAGSGNNVARPLFPRSLEYARAYWPNDTLRSAPKFYADYDRNHWLVAPTPDAAYPFEVLFWSLPQPLDATHQTNWLTTDLSDLLRFATFYEAALLAKDAEEIATWKPEFEGAAALLTGEDIMRIIDRSASRRTS